MGGNRWQLRKYVNKKQRYIACYETLAEANGASIIFHKEIFNGRNFEKAKEITRRSTNHTKEEKSKGVEQCERGVYKHRNRWQLRKMVNKKNKYIAEYKTLAEANEASIIFHKEIFNGRNFEKAKEITRKSMNHTTSSV